MCTKTNTVQRLGEDNPKKKEIVAKVNIFTITILRLKVNDIRKAQK